MSSGRMIEGVYLFSQRLQVAEGEIQMVFRVVLVFSGPMHSALYKCTMPCCMCNTVQKYTGTQALCVALHLYAQCLAYVHSASIIFPYVQHSLLDAQHLTTLPCVQCSFLYSQRPRFLRTPIHSNSCLSLCQLSMMKFEK